MSELYEELKKKLEIINNYDHVCILLYWDMDTALPQQAFEDRSRVMTYFSTESFKLQTDPNLKSLLLKLNEEEELQKLETHELFTVKRMLRDFERNERIPVDFYSEYVRVQAESEHAWENAKRSSDYKLFAPYLKQIIELTRKKTEYSFPGQNVYDSLIGLYEEGMDSKTIDRLFDELKAGLVPLVKRILKAKQPDSSLIPKSYNPDDERKAQEFLLKYIGFDFTKGTVGESEHPFTTGFSSKDVRVTNHFRRDNAIDPIFSAIHEGGHAIFEQNVNPEYDGTVAHDCTNMGIHESQSRFYENILGRNINFWKPIYGKLQEIIKELEEVSLDSFYREINHVENSLIRTMADEVTYCLHIIIRYELEKDIFDGKVSVEELPALWNAKMKEYLDIEPSNDAEGILQDMHWSDGSFGYFPSYLLGSIYDGMFLEAIEKELGSIDTILAQGEICKITEWLNKKIHYFGNTRSPKEVLEAVCGREVSAAPLLKYFTEKYERVYDL